jgi:hypothetical protein
MPAHHYLGLSTAWLLAATSFSTAAFAQSSADTAAAKALFDQGRKLAAEGNYDAACAKLEASLASVNGAGTRFNLADCEEHRRHYLRAQTLFLQVAELAHEAGQTEREQVARDRAAALEPKLSRLTVELQTPAVEFELDGQPVDNEALVAPVAVEPGRHRVSAKRPGKEPWSSEINVPRPGLFVVVKVPRLDDAAGASPAVATPAPAATTAPLGGATPAAPAARSNREESAPRPSLAPLSDSEEPTTYEERARTARNAKRAALVIGGIGVGALLTGATFGLQYLSSNHDAKGVCPSSTNCTADEVAAHQTFLEDTRTKRTWAYVGIGVGTAALAGAAALYFTLGSQGNVEASTGMSPDGSFNLAVRSRF